MKQKSTSWLLEIIQVRNFDIDFLNKTFYKISTCQTRVFLGLLGPKQWERCKLIQPATFVFALERNDMG